MDSLNDQLSECVTDMWRIFAHMLSQHTLKKKMTPDEILVLLNVKLPVNERDLDNMPEGLSKDRAKKILSLCAEGVPDGHFVHTKLQKIVKETTQHSEFHFARESRIGGPLGKDKKEKHIIDWLAEQAGEVGPPLEEEAVARLPPKWGKEANKKVKNMLEKVISRKNNGYINWATSREIVKKEDDKLYNDTYMICGDKKDKAVFLNLVAWLDENEKKSDNSLKKAVETRGSKFIDVDTLQPVKVTNTTKQEYYFNAKSGLAVKKEDTKEATKAKHEKYLKILNDE